jgi:ribonucleoside-diphosphate reductase subunit M2
MTRSREVHIINACAQAAASLESLKVKDSPIKKPVFSSEDKENMPAAFESAEPVAKSEIELEKTPVVEVSETVQQPEVPKTLKELEKEEPLLQENTHRFVLFPLKYHEIVRVLSRRPISLALLCRLTCPWLT